MTFYLADAGLSSNLGHHASAARAIVSELIKRNIPVAVLAHQNVAQSIGNCSRLRIKPALLKR